MPSPQSPESDGTPVEGGGPDNTRGRRPDEPDGLDEAVLDAVFTQSAVGLHVLDRDLRVVRVNTVAAGMRGVPQEQVVGLTASEAYAPFAEGVDERVLREVLTTGHPRREVLVRGRPPTDPDREHVFSTSTFRLTDRRGRTIGVVTTAVDVTQRERAEGRLRLLHAVRERIGQSLDVLRIAQDLTDVTVPGFADSVVVALTDDVLRGEDPHLSLRTVAPLLRCAATAGSDGAGVLPRVGTILLPGLFGERLPGEPTLLPTESEGRALPTALVASFTVRGRLLGAVAFHRRPTTSPFEPEDLLLAADITARTATCLENSLRFSREHIVMTALQSWPRKQPETTRNALEVSQRHRHEGHGAGSWCDVIPLSSARVALVAGRVEQSGVSAVATMSQLRTAVHTLATLDLEPHELLARLHLTTRRLAREQRELSDVEEPSAGCAIAVHDPVSGLLDIARAGNCFLALTRPDGSVEPEPLPVGSLLGADGPPFPSRTYVLEPGSTVCLASRSTGASSLPVEALTRALSHPQHPTETMADALEGLLGPEEVLLVARTQRLPDDHVTAWDLPADPAAVADARRLAGRCLERWGTPVDRFTVELVVSELVTNAIRYGAPPIALRLVRQPHLLTCEVEDASMTAPYLRHARESDEGGRGLYICASLTDSWGTRYTASGKTVWAAVDLPQPETDRRGGGHDAHIP
ncbi:SpoIIE family protein phosphatase [Streptomyces bobili]|jgi:PAS domain S-box-containing protein|uniref:SpoIIE family protein phosphatase n=1 Tax=Streptomyces bobili TaxID=67280 RepID=UPI000A3C43EC|nr:SpoIIE family protein phosphatase [Streptomyces bobili]